jgi:hypothetical protein
VLDGPFRGSEALAAGLVTRGALYGPRYRRVFPDVFAPADRELDLEIRSRAAYLLVRDRFGVLAGYSAALLLGADCARKHAPAEVLVLGDFRAHRGLRVSRAVVSDAEIALADGCRVTTPLRTAWDLARRLPLIEAVVAVDALSHLDGHALDQGGRFRPADLLSRRAKEPGARGCRRLEKVVALADSRAESPMETRLRLGLVLAGLPSPDVQYELLDEYGYHLARIDLAYPAAKLAIEYDGAFHFDQWRARRDRQRDAKLAGYGWLTLRLVDDDVLAMPQTVSRVRTLLALRTAADAPPTSTRFIFDLAES